MALHTQSSALHLSAGGLVTQVPLCSSLGGIYVDDLVIIDDSLKDYVSRRLLIWKEAMVEKGLKENAGKTKAVICSTGLDLLHNLRVPICCLS